MTKQTIQDRLRLLLGEETVFHFANRCGLPDSTLRKYMSGSQPTADRLALISRCSGVSVDWLVSGEGPMFRKMPQPESPDRLVRIPTYILITRILSMVLSEPLETEYNLT